MRESFIYVADLNGLNLRFTTAEEYADFIRKEYKNPKTITLAVKENPRFLAFAQGVTEYLPSQTGEVGFLPDGQSVWRDGDTPSDEYPKVQQSIWLMGLPKSAKSGPLLMPWDVRQSFVFMGDEERDLLISSLILHTIVHVASKWGLTVLVDSMPPVVFLPNGTFLGKNLDAPTQELCTTYYSPPFILHDTKEEIPSKEQVKELVDQWCDRHLKPLGFEKIKGVYCRDSGESQQTISIWLQLKTKYHEDYGVEISSLSEFSVGYPELLNICKAVGLSKNYVGSSATMRLEYLLSDEQRSELMVAGIYETDREELRYGEIIFKSLKQWSVFERVCLNDTFLKNIHWFDQFQTLDGLYNYLKNDPQGKYRFHGELSLVCFHLFSDPDYETNLISNLVRIGNEGCYRLDEYLRAHVTPRNGILPPYRRTLSAQEALQMPARSAVLPVLTEERYGLNMVVLPAGSFDMGSDRSSMESPIHRVHVPSFALGMYPVTQQQWEAVMGHNPSFFKGANRPVESITWQDTQAFIAKLNEQTGQTYRLPSEAEWEYACKAGTTGKWYFGEDEALLQDHEWYADNSDLRTHPVGQKQPNPYGLYDMLGNVEEWCQDGDGSYRNTPTDGSAYPWGIETTSSHWHRCVIRGGSFAHNADKITSSFRSFKSAFRSVREDSPLHRNIGLGFRLAMTLK